MTNEPSSEQWNVTGNVQRNVYIGNQGPIIPDNQGTVNITYEAAPLPQAIGVANNLRRSGTLAFVGRDDMLAELHRRVQANERLAIVSIRGMGGVGKTELALQYGLRYGQTYPGGLCWLRARESVGLQIIAFARAQLDVNPPTDLELLDQVAYCWRHWPAGEVLIIFDDVQRYPDIESFLPPLEQRFKTLLITRQQMGGALSELTLGILARTESLALLQMLVSDGRIEAAPNQANWLCDWLGDLPLGLELVGRYLAQKPTVTLATLRDRLERKRLDARALESAYPGMTATAGIAAAFEVSWELLAPEVQRLAELLSVFALAPIPWQLVRNCLVNVDEEDLEDWRDSLVGLHLLQRLDVEGEHLYQLHQLLREFFAVKLSESAQVGDLAQRFCQVMVTLSRQIPARPTINDIAAVELAIPHLIETATTLKDSLSNDHLIAPFKGLGRFYQGQGLYRDAEPWYEQCLTFTRDHLGDEHPDVANSLNNLALLYYRQGRYSEVEPLYQEALAMRKRLLGDEHSSVALSLNNLAGLYNSQGRYSEAEPLFQEALAMHKRLLGDEHSSVALSLSNLALLYNHQGRYSEAEPLFQEALAMRKRLLGDEHSSVANSLSNLAVLYYSQGRYSEAEPLYQEALAMYRRLLGDDHPNVALSLNNLAKLYYNQGRYSEAEPLFQEALAIFKQSLGDEHPNVGRCSDNLAMLYSAQGKSEEAKLLCTEALAILEQSLGTEHSWTIRCWENLETLNAKHRV